MNNYNSSQYYRANPYKDLGYMPPIALKNRRSPEHIGQIPQGQQYFQPSAKKHFHNSYKNEIQQEKVIGAFDAMSPLQRQAMQRSYFRSLNSKDIQGASTNTLISKAVKNKMKAQQELQRRREMERQAEQIEKQIKYQKEQQRKRMVQNYHNKIIQEREKLQKQELNNNIQNSPKNLYSNKNSYHYEESSEERQRKNRQAELLKLAQQRKNYAIVDFNSLYNYHNRQRDENPQVNNSLSQTKQEPQYNQNKNLQDNKARKEYESSKKVIQAGYLQKRSEENQDQTRFHKVQRGSPIYKYEDIKPESSTEHRNINNNYSVIQKDEMRKYQNYSLPHENTYQIKQQNTKERIQAGLFKQPEIVKAPQYYDSSAYYPQYYGARYEEGRTYAQKTEPQVKHSVLQKRSREQLRRMNPTFLSYGSPSFAVASKNVIGY